MELTKKNLRDGSCNFCRRGVISKEVGGLRYPYKFVVEIKSDSTSSVSVRMCEECLAEIQAFILY